MKRSGAKHVIAAALSWDGARLPVGSLPAKARDFLLGKKSAQFSAKKMAELFTNDAVGEIRICWAPQLRGGDAVLSEVFPTPKGKRLAFRAVQTKVFGNYLGVVYRKTISEPAQSPTLQR